MKNSKKDLEAEISEEDETEDELGEISIITKLLHMKKLKDPDYLSSGLFRTNWADQWNLCILLTVLIEDDTISSFEIMDVSKELMEYWGLGESDDVYNIEEISDELAGLDIIDVCKELDERFGIAHIAREWYGIGLSKQCGTLYGLLILLASSFVQVRDTTKDILKRLLRFEMGRVAGGWEPISMLFLMGDLEDAKANFLGNVKPWCEVKKEIKLESIMEAINLVVDLMEEGRQHITHSSCRLLSYCVLHCSHLEVLSYLFEKLSPNGRLPNCQTIDKDGDPLLTWSTGFLKLNCMVLHLMIVLILQGNWLYAINAMIH